MSKALELLEKSKNMLIENNGDFIAFECLEVYSVCKQALLKAQEQEKALKLIKEKNVSSRWLNYCDTVDLYNKCVLLDDKLTQEEFDLLKEVLE